MPALIGSGRDATLPDVPVEAAEDVVEVGVRPGDRRPAQRPGEVAVLAVRGAALGQIDPPVGAGRDRLQRQLRRWGHHDRQRPLGLGVGLARVAANGGEPIRRQQLDVVDAGSLTALDDGAAVLALVRRSGDQHSLGHPASRSHVEERRDSTFGNDNSHTVNNL
jgi:hypothetical protein